MSQLFTFSWVLSLPCHIASAVCLRNVCSSDFQELQCLDTCAACSVVMNTKCGAIFGRFSFFFPLNWVASIPKGFELRDVPRYPENGSLLTGSSSGNACICPVGAEFWWGRGESNLLIAVVFRFPHYFYESACILRPCSEIECAECNSACAPLGIA